MRTFVFLLYFCSTLVAWAQKGLQIAPFFAPEMAKQPTAIFIKRTGKVLVPYKLSLFQSISLPLNEAQVKQLEGALRSDTQQALSREEGYQRGRLYYGFYQLSPSTKEHRYVFYRNNSLSSSAEGNITLIYMQGSASVTELKRTFGNK